MFSYFKSLRERIERKSLRKWQIDCVKRNPYHSGWVIYGAVGIRFYYTLTRKESIKSYKKECKCTRE